MTRISRREAIVGAAAAALATDAASADAATGQGRSGPRCPPR